MREGPLRHESAFPKARTRKAAVKSAFRVCEKCGTEIPTDAPEGGCPGCLLETALDATSGQKVFGRFKLVKVLGRGGMGIVSLCDEGLERNVPEISCRSDDSGSHDF